MGTSGNGPTRSSAEHDEGRTFRVDARGQETTEDDLGLSEEDARELFHRMRGRGLGIKIIDEKTGDVLLQDPDAEESYASALDAVDRHRRAMGCPCSNPHHPAGPSRT